MKNASSGLLWSRLAVASTAAQVSEDLDAAEKGLPPMPPVAQRGCPGFVLVACRILAELHDCQQRSRSQQRGAPASQRPRAWRFAFPALGLVCSGYRRYTISLSPT